MDIKKKIRKLIMPSVLKRLWYVNVGYEHLPKDFPYNTDIVRFIQTYNICKEIKENGIKGDVAELGVYKGSFTRLLSYCFRDTDKKLLLYDTFNGFDKRDKIDKAVYDDFSNTSIDIVKKKISKSKFNLSNCIFKKGWFPKTFDINDSDNFCLISLDMDLYMPTMVALDLMYDMLSVGGYILLHDYGNSNYPGIKDSFEDFKNKYKNTFVYFNLCDYCSTMIIKKVR